MKRACKRTVTVPPAQQMRVGLGATSVIAISGLVTPSARERLVSIHQPTLDGPISLAAQETRDRTKRRSRPQHPKVAVALRERLHFAGSCRGKAEPAEACLVLATTDFSSCDTLRLLSLGRPWRGDLRVEGLRN